ncbi:MAG: anthranilate synthase component I family protein [Thermoplasmata archaeon]|nr:anthranilate synthase component I family protein [Thermoplasmata archaeon]
MTDPWERFAARAERAEIAGYFERAAGHAGKSGLAVWFDRGEALPPIAPRTDLDEVARITERHLRSDPRAVAMGYLGFDAVGLIEPALATFPAGSPFPLGEVVLASRANVHRPVSVPPWKRRRLPSIERPPLTDSMSRARFRASVGRLRSAIRSGEAFQIVLAHRRRWPSPTDLIARAGRLRRSERFAFFYYLKVGDREIVGATPESVVEVEGRSAQINPIAGTRPLAPRSGRRSLKQDPKELSEHRMLVDLARNDLGRVARPGTVRVLWKERRQRYAHLEHLVSRVAGRLPRGVGPWEVLRATFPAGTVSGAPKIRATQWLRREERTWRGPYGGTVGLLRPGGRADWALAIRGGFATRGSLYTAAGAGIVHASIPNQEYDETLLKLANVESALVGGPT